jgi:hypothetical protein
MTSKYTPLARIQIPQDDCLISTSAKQFSAVAGKGQMINVIPMTLQYSAINKRQFPNARLIVSTARRQKPSIR